MLLILIVGLLAAPAIARAQQLSGQYSVGGPGANYATIEAALTALASNGVGGPVTFSINGGTYTPPTGGYTLPSVAGMSATRTVTFRPAAGANVVIDGSMSGDLFDINGGDFYILDGANVVGGNTRNWKIINRGGGAALRLINGASNNTIRNMNLIADNISTTSGVLKMENSIDVGNSNNAIVANTIGDSSGTFRSVCGIYLSGISSSANVANVVDNNDIINFGKGTSGGYGIYISNNNHQVKIFRNRIRLTVTSGVAGAKYGIYNSNTSNLNDTIAYNRIWALNTSVSNSNQFGIYIADQGSSPVVAHNNMISLIAAEGALHGIFTAESDPLHLYYNSIHIGGSTASGATVSSNIGSSSTSAAITMRNNALANVRSSLGDGTNVLISMAGGTLTSNYNLLYANAAGTATFALAADVYTTLAQYQGATSNDLNSVGGNPQFVNPTAGDLHIASGARTAAEGRGRAVTGITLDADGALRSTTTPDIGADEGSFLPLLQNNMRVDRLLYPTQGKLVRSGTLFNPTVLFANVGTSTQSNVQVRYRIWNSMTGALVYHDLQKLSTLTEAEREQIAFSQSGNVSGSTSLPVGTYTVEVRTELASDGDTTDNAAYATIIVKEAMNGVYTINRGGTGARNFTSFTRAIGELNDLGVSGAVRFDVAGGTYDATTGETFPLRLLQIPFASGVNTVTFRPATGATVVVTGLTGNPIFELSGASHVVLNGANTENGASRNWKVINRGAGAVIRLANGATYNTITNMNLIADTTASTMATIKIDNSVSYGNSYNRIIANTIGDSTGTLRSNQAIFLLGSPAAPNVGNVIENNDIINFGNRGNNGFGVLIGANNQLVKILRNRFTMTATAGTTGAKAAIYHSNTTNLNDTIAYNRIWGLNSENAGASQYGIYIAQQGSSPIVVHSNMIALVAAQGGLFGIFNEDVDPLHVYHNSIYIGGSTSQQTTTSANVLNTTSSQGLTIRNNILMNMRSSLGSETNRAMDLRGAVTSDHNVLFAKGQSTLLVRHDNSSYNSLAAWRGTKRDTLSLGDSVTFIDPAAGDLHLDKGRVYKAEGLGMALGIPFDADGDLRDLVTPDIGADEDDFNGDGIRVVSPNNGETVIANHEFALNYTTNRPMSVRFELSTDGGETWMNKGSVNRTERGANTATITTPDVMTSRALVRVINARNAEEMDASNATFSIVLPSLIVAAPNGGERFVPGDTARVRWQSRLVPQKARINIEYSTNGGATWSTAVTGLSSENFPAVNTADWIVPNSISSNVLVRVHIPGTSSRDTSDRVFSILSTPVVTVIAPNGGERWFGGDRKEIRWSATSTDNVRIEYSLDGGESWSNAIGNGTPSVPAYLGSFEWTVPNTPSTTALVRVTNDERPRFSDRSDALFTIAGTGITITAPNGGEQYELNEPVTVTWTTLSSSNLRIEYSDNGRTWQTVAASVSPTPGSFTFTPPQKATRNARIRIVSTERPDDLDISNAPFEILEVPSLMVFSPAQGDRLPVGSTTVISWEAIRVTSIDIEYSANGGTSWESVAKGVNASTGSHVWQAPSARTAQGKIRIREVGGSLIAESGIFSIVDATAPTVRVIAPNGGEKFTGGDETTIRWTASDVTSVTVSYSSDNGGNWTTIQSNVPATLGQITWTVPGVAGTGYRVRIAATGASDESDGSFEVEVVTTPEPTITLIAPNGGETLQVGAEATIRWSQAGLTVTPTIEYSIDNGGNWKPVTTTSEIGDGTFTFTWTVPNDPSMAALVRVTSGTVSDASDAVFTIAAEPTASLRLITPNGGESWIMGTQHDIEWEATAVANIAIRYSTNGGANWIEIAPSVATASGKYTWTVPSLAMTTPALVRIEDVANGTLFDESNSSFTILATSGVDEPVTTGTGLRLAGNFPNPFASHSEIRWQQGSAQNIVLRIYEQSGRLVEERTLGLREAGDQRVEVAAGSLSNGVYIYELKGDAAAARGVMVIVR